MDIGMPVVDGYQATEAIRQLSSKVPIVAVTAFAYDEDKRKVMSRGFNGYLSKPLNKEALFDMLRQWEFNLPKSNQWWLQRGCV